VTTTGTPVTRTVWIVFIGLTTFQFLITVTLFGGLARQVRRA